MQKYPSGSRGSPAKGVVWENRSEGSNPSFCAKKGRKDVFFSSVFCDLLNRRRDSRVGAVLREQNALPYGSWVMINLTAKAAIDNCRAGRAAKGANPVIRTSKSTNFDRSLSIFSYLYKFLILRKKLAVTY